MSAKASRVGPPNAEKSTAESGVGPISATSVTAEEILYNSSVGFAVYHPDGRCEVANDAIAELVGTSRDELLKRNFRRLESWKRTGLLEAALGTLASGDPSCLDVHTISTFGKEVWVECRFSRIETGAGQRLFLITSDITDRKPTLPPDPIEKEGATPWKRFLQQVVSPRGGYDPQTTVQTRLVIALSLASFFLISTAVLVLAIYYDPEGALDHPIVVIGGLSALGMLLTYLWARSRASRFRSAGIAVIINCLAAPMSASFLFDSHYIVGMLVGLVLASALLSQAWVVALSALTVGSGFLLAALDPAVVLDADLLVELVVAAVVGSLLAFLPWHYRLLEGARQVELARRNRELLHEIAGRKEAEAALRSHAALQEVLVQEINHRVRNNLSAILGMISAERKRSRRGADCPTEEVLTELDRRIRGIAAAHDVLTEHEWQPVPVSELCEAVLRMASSGASQEVEIDVAPSTTVVSDRQTHHLALVLAELVANSLKHAGDQAVRLSVALDATDDRIVVRYQDDGPGFSESILSGEREQGHLGLRLLDGIVSHSLQGRMTLSNGAGAVTTLDIPREGAAVAA